jgi:hypothetical protein
MTIIMHVYLSRNVMGPLENLSLEVAAKVDIQDGEFETSHKVDLQDGELKASFRKEDSLYEQPSLKDGPEDRVPLPYRRESVEEQTPV